MSIRVGLVTLNGNFNYGNRFQNYALLDLKLKCNTCSTRPVLYSD